MVITGVVRAFLAVFPRREGSGAPEIETQGHPALARQIRTMMSSKAAAKSERWYGLPDTGG